MLLSLLLSIILGPMTDSDLVSVCGVSTDPTTPLLVAVAAALIVENELMSTFPVAVPILPPASAA